MDLSSRRMDVSCIGNNTKLAENETKNVKTCQVDQKTQNSPKTPENGMPKSSYRWRKVSVNNIDAYVPWSMPIEALGQTFAFGEAQSGGKAIVPSIDGGDIKERAGSRNGDDGDVDDTESSSNIDSQRVKGAQLSIESQRLHPHRRSQENLPVSS